MILVVVRHTVRRISKRDLGEAGYISYGLRSDVFAETFVKKVNRVLCMFE